MNDITIDYRLYIMESIYEVKCVCSSLVLHYQKGVYLLYFKESQ